MEKKREITIAVVIALIIAVISLGVAFAAFSTQLTINGSATVQASSWSVFFAPGATSTKPASAATLPDGNITTHGTATSTTASLAATSFTWGATLKTPGDYVIYHFYARNTGDYNASISNTITPAITCTYADESSAQTFCNSHVTYGIYTDSSCTIPVAQNQTLNHGTNADYYVKVMLLNNFNSNGSDLPTQNVNVAATTVTVTYQQAN